MKEEGKKGGKEWIEKRIDSEITRKEEEGRKE